MSNRLPDRSAGRPTSATQNPAQKSIRVGIVDDHPLFRSGLRRLLEREDGLWVEWEMSTARELPAALERQPVDVVLMDLELGPGIDGLEATRTAMAKQPSLKVIVLTGSLDPQSPAKAAAAGATGFLPKQMGVPELLASIRRIASGEAGPSAHAADEQLRLTRRERQVLAEVRKGRTNREIARTLGVATTTVNKHVQQILKKLRVTNRVQAAGR